MSASISFKISPTVLEWARTTMGFSIEETAKKIGVTLERYRDWEDGKKLPTYKQLEDLAEKVYKRPLAVLLLSSPPKESSIQKDFRTLSNSQISNLSPEIRLALRKAKRYQLILEEVAEDVFKTHANLSVAIKDDPEIVAQKFRNILGLSLEDQKTWKHEEAFKNFQSKIENLGIYVFKMSFPFKEARAFCINGQYPIIVLNIEDSKNGRIFSLIHEVCHILLNTSDIFNDIKTELLTEEYQKIETFCNQFAASFLIPDESFRSEIRRLLASSMDVSSDSTIQSFARLYNVSNEVIARKLLNMNLISSDLFWSKKRFWDQQARSAKEREKEREKKKEGGINQGIKILYEKGRPYVTSVLSAYNNGYISSSDVSNYLETKLTNLPKIIERLDN